MRVFQSDTHRAELSADGVLDVFTLAGRTIKELSFIGTDVSFTEHTAKDGSPPLRTLLDIMDNSPVFRAAFAQNDVFHVDYETGTQRSKGYKTTEELKNMLIKCEFSINEIESIITEGKQTKHTLLARIN